jgi:hypothetical protein
MRSFITALAVLVLIGPARVLAGPAPGCPCRCGGCCASTEGGTDQAAPMVRGGGMGMSAGEHAAIGGLLTGHKAIRRTVTEIPGGVRTTTTTTDSALIGTLRAHVRQMARRLEQGRPVRMWDPVFRGVFAHADEITVATKDIDGGIEVTETSENPDVVPLIRAHAAKVSAFAEQGHAAARPPWAGRGRGPMMRGRGPMMRGW